MDLGDIAETVANVGEGLMKSPELILILVLLISKLANIW